MTPARRYRWGVAGTGTLVARFARELARTDRGERYGVASRSPDRAERFARRHGFQRAFPSLEAMLDDADLDVVYLATPTRHHVAHCRLALRAGKAVLCEKPLAVSEADARLIVDEARERQLFCMEAMWMRFHPLVQDLRRRLLAGELGDIHHLHAELGWPKPADRVEDPALGRGALLDFGVYPLSFAHYLLGAPDAVTGVTRHHSGGGDETVAAQLVYPGCVASIAASVGARLANDAIVAGSRATARLGAPLLAPRWLDVEPGEAGATLPARLGRFARRLLSRRPLQPRIGLRREAEEVMRCLDAGRLESDVMPLSASLEVLACVDRIREGAAAASR